MSTLINGKYEQYGCIAPDHLDTLKIERVSIDGLDFYASHIAMTNAFLSAFGSLEHIEGEILVKLFEQNQFEKIADLVKSAPGGWCSNMSVVHVYAPRQIIRLELETYCSKRKLILARNVEKFTGVKVSAIAEGGSLTAFKNIKKLLIKNKKICQSAYVVGHIIDEDDE